MTTPTATELPTWKRFADAPPPDGFYWSRYTDELPGWYTVVEVAGNWIRFIGTDLTNVCITNEYATSNSREYFTQPILPPV